MPLHHPSREPRRPRPPGPIKGPSAWLGSEVRSKRDWLCELGPEDVDELLQANRKCFAAGLSIDRISRREYCLPTLGERLCRLLQELLHGRGFALIRGLPRGELSDVEIAATFWGIGSHLGRALLQNAAGHLLGHVTDLGLSSEDPAVRIYQTHERQGFHTDSADLVGLLCLQTAQQGGRSSLVSVSSVYNRMLANCPEHLPPLFEDFYTDHRGEAPICSEPFFRAPILHWHADELSVLYQRAYIESAQRYPGVPTLSAEQIAALDAFDALLEDPDLQLSMDLEPGDIQFIHNHQLLHDRSAFQDGPDQRRHLMRLWLSPAEGRALPECFAERFGSLEPGQRGGVQPSEGVIPTAPLNPLDSR